MSTGTTDVVPRTQDALNRFVAVRSAAVQLITQGDHHLIDPGEALQELPLLKLSNGGHSLLALLLQLQRQADVYGVIIAP